jgi:ribosomal-protein-alanine N-acetyltransferase
MLSMTAPVQAKLGRFLIRDINPWEGPGVFALTGDHNVMRYMGFPVHRSVDDATKLIAQYRESPSKWQAICLDGDTTDILGIVGLEVRGHQATMSIMVRRDRKARGIGREFGKPFVQWIFTHPTIWRVWSYVHVDNIDGQNVTERTGAVREGRLRRFEFFPNVSDEPQDCYVYAIVR